VADRDGLHWVRGGCLPELGRAMIDGRQQVTECHRMDRHTEGQDWNSLMTAARGERRRRPRGIGHARVVPAGEDGRARGAAEQLAPKLARADRKRVGAKDRYVRARAARDARATPDHEFANGQVSPRTTTISEPHAFNAGGRNRNMEQPGTVHGLACLFSGRRPASSHRRRTVEGKRGQQLV